MRRPLLHRPFGPIGRQEPQPLTREQLTRLAALVTAGIDELLQLSAAKAPYERIHHLADALSCVSHGRPDALAPENLEVFGLYEARWAQVHDVPPGAFTHALNEIIHRTGYAARHPVEAP
jgi:hypothetical protein